MGGRQFALPPEEGDGSPRPSPKAAAEEQERSAGSTASWRPSVSGDVAAVVIGRAAELEQQGTQRAGAGLDEQALVEIGRDVGLSADVVRQALDEYHAGLLQTAGAGRRTIVGPRALVIERTVPGPIERVDALLSAFLDRKVFDCCRRAGHRSVWRPREGVLASLHRVGKRLTRDRTLDDVTEITVALAELPAEAGRPPGVRVRLEVECEGLRRGLVTTSVGGMAVGGLGAVAATGAAVVTGDPTPLVGLPPLAALGAGAYVGSRHVYGRKLEEVELVLQGGLDDLVRMT